MKNLILATVVTLYSATALAVPCPKCGTDVPGLIPIVVPPVTPEALGPQVTPQSLAALTIAAPVAQPSCPAEPAGDARQTVRGYIQKLMDETRTLACGEQRGSAGSYAKLAKEQVEEFVSAIIYAADKFGPKQLKAEEKWALLASEISIESAFVPDTSGVNPGDGRYKSVGPLQLSLPAQAGIESTMWDRNLREYCKVELKHYDGSAWDVPKTDNSALEHSIWDNIVASYWAITEQGRRGCPDWLGQPNDGPAPKTIETALLGWVLGCPCVVNGTDLANQRAKYIDSMSTDLKLLGFSPDLIKTPF